MYTVEQIRKAGVEGEISSIDVEHLIDVLNRLYASTNDAKNAGGELPFVPTDEEMKTKRIGMPIIYVEKGISWIGKDAHGVEYFIKHVSGSQTTDSPK